MFLAKLNSILSLKAILNLLTLLIKGTAKNANNTITSPNMTSVAFPLNTIGVATKVID